ncbi:TraR/DksA family transcriptional regulator [Duganella sp. BJB488]|uniref:TraR/DksA family transcriptional regulator n=1 Tax=unclassified Duganella TaxID=2636909 RepID=UPI000E3542A4|nr:MULTISPECIES: TraR/DksA family transcriptional regulator [unclassified Duganella]NVD70889.1 TraR/DksA family transcriptional regulator [Duganella sp. BJB1802]RFP15120.1 TraR/DksA family transcriptional regulator [Duganella sp. BJB489]RFP19674.1 TraR/DksA family transcriptional regulator [Duganella sp. BJB488]RFP38064.1 TraR/DksA family transcriptional regulator [Duganella sp. BJB480]
MNGLDDIEWTTLRERLERARAALLSQLADDLDRSADVRAPAPHEAEASPADNASQRTLNALVHEAAEHTARQLHIVRHALAKFDDRSYGLCERCGELIGYSRLNARPEARLCIACQTLQEQRRR